MFLVPRPGKMFWVCTACYFGDHKNCIRDFITCVCECYHDYAKEDLK
jgi:hypothetical protein